MRKTGFLLVMLLLLEVTKASAAIVNFFGEDVNRAGNGTATPVNSSAASGRFLANLANIGTETFESFATGTFVPLNVNFSGLGSAVLSGTGTVVSGANAGGQF